MRYLERFGRAYGVFKLLVFTWHCYWAEKGVSARCTQRQTVTAWCCDIVCWRGVNLNLVVSEVRNWLTSYVICWAEWRQSTCECAEVKAWAWIERATRVCCSEQWAGVDHRAATTIKGEIRRQIWYSAIEGVGSGAWTAIGEEAAWTWDYDLNWNRRRYHATSHILDLNVESVGASWNFVVQVRNYHWCWSWSYVESDRTVRRAKSTTCFCNGPRQT